MPRVSSGRCTAVCIGVICVTVGLAAAAAGRAAGGPQHAASSANPRVWLRDARIVEAANEVLQTYAGSPARRKAPNGLRAVEVAKLRRSALERLIRRDPETALRLSLSPRQRQGLPQNVLALLEKRIHAVGDLTQGLTESFPPDPSQSGPPNQAPEGPLPPPQISWSVEIDGTSRQAFVYGLRLKHQTKYETPLHGIALDDLMAVDESPLYLYDPFEAEQLGFQPGQIVATSGGAPIPLPDLEAFDQLRRELLAEILRPGPYLDVNLYPWTTGPISVLVIKADYEDRPGTLYTDGQISAVVDETDAFFGENSQGLTSLVPTVIPDVLRLPATSVSYEARGEVWGHERIESDAIDAARAYDTSMGGTGMYDPAFYDRIVVLTPQVFARPIARGDLGGKGVVLTGRRLVFAALAHELGHTYGFLHSGFWLVDFGADPIGPGAFAEYGDVWDMMGAPTLDRTDEEPHRRHFNSYFKWRAGWLPSGAFADATGGGVFRLRPHDAADADGLRAIRIDAGDRVYWLDMRRQFPWNPSMVMGIEVRRVLEDPAFVYGPLQLLDLDPTDGTAVLHSLVRFDTFEDAARGVDVRIANVFHDAMGDYADIVITP